MYTGKSSFFFISILLLIVMIPLPVLCQQPAYEKVDAQDAPGRTLARKAVQDPKYWNTTDHSKHEALQMEFTSGPEVTRACLGCHTEASSQFHRTIHWTWLDPNVPASKMIGKRGYSVNNFCISIHGNWPRCTSCHAGYGWEDASFDFSNPYAIDCLVCHEQTGTYVKFPAGAGHPAKEPAVFKSNGKTYYPPDWNKVAQSVGRPTRKNCGTCHFYGGGGDGVKHGDLDSSLFKPDKNLDVHMGMNGENFDCVRCHTTRLHKIAGRIYGTPAAKERKSLIEDDLTSKIMCESCHSATPHKKEGKMNDHTNKVACQSCHIPYYARINPTKVWWDWSKSGQKKDGKPFSKKGPYGKAVYVTKKGEFEWVKNGVPEYYWFNGSISGTTAKDVINPAKPVRVAWPVGSKDDPGSRIFPFKIHKGKQPYDKVNKTLLIPHLFGKKGTGAYWADYDWKKALASGMQHAGLPFSGEFDFVETRYVYPTTHMVAPKDNALACVECHHHSRSRLAALSGFYMPGRDRIRALDTLGILIVLGSLVGVFFHGIGRVFAGKRKGE